MSTAKPFCVLLLFTISTSCTVAQQPAPVMEYASVVTGLHVRHRTGVLEFENANHALASAFLPQGAMVEAVVTKKGGKAPLVRQTFAVSQTSGVFNRLSVRGNHSEFKFTEPGDYVVTYLSNGRPMTVMPFSVEFVKNDDVFDPKTFYYVNGPWMKWAYMYAPLPDAATDQPEFRMWARKKSFIEGRNADEYNIELRLNGDVVAVASTGFISTQEGRELKFQLRHPESKGGQAVKVSELIGTNGTYHVVVKKNDSLFGVWPFVVADGRPQLHARQASDYSPRTEYIVPRVSGISNRAPGNVVFMERLPDSEAQAVYEGRAAAVAGPTDEDRERWNWIPRDIDPGRPFRLTVSSVETRTDTGFAVGEDMVVFGTGFPNGVKYMLAGDQQAREIPAGETFSSKYFCVCGRKIVLTKRSRVFVFDTKTERMTEIPESEISLYNPSSEQITSSGYLVATVNKATAVKDNTIIKVIDVSGDVPVVIPIKNANYTDSDVTAVAVDAKHGHLAVASRSKKLITAAKIANLAGQYLYDVSEYRGVASFPITIEGDDVTYIDEDWKVRRLELTSKSPKAITQEPIGRSGNGYWVRKGFLVAVSKEESVGSRYRMVVTESDDAPQVVPGTGTPIKGTGASLGMGGSAAIAIDKTVFIAGTPGDSIGTGERLQMLTDNGWMPIPGDDGTPIHGSEVVTSMGFMALKVRNATGKTVIGYATYGERITPPTAGTVSASNAPAPKMTRPTGPVVPLPIEKESSFASSDETEYDVLRGYVEVNDEVRIALEGAFGKDGARKKMVEMTVNAMKSAGNEHLIDEFKRLSPLVPDSEKPKAENSPTGKPINVDPQQIAATLTGEWKALRFTASGEDLPDAAIETLKLVFANGKYVMQVGGSIETGTYKFDSTVYPFGLTISIGSGKNKGQSRQGSFKFLEDNRLMFVMGTNETDRPARFVSNKENECILAVYSKR